VALRRGLSRISSSLLREIIMATLAFLLLQWVFPSNRLAGPLGPFVRHLCILFTSATFALILVLWRIRSQIMTLSEISRKLAGPGRNTLMPFISNSLEELDASIKALLSEGGTTMSHRDLDRLTGLCFEYGQGVYHGSDSHVPSEFLERYPLYLNRHLKNISKRNNPGYRILVVRCQDLKVDLSANLEQVEYFYNLHIDNGIRLLQIDPSQATAISSRLFLDVTDMGIWDWKLVLLFKSSNGGRISVSAVTRDDVAFERCVSFYKLLLNEANGVQMVRSSIKCHPRSLAVKDADFANLGDPYP